VTADLMGLLALFSPQVLVPGYEQYTGLSWAALTQDAPEIAKFFPPGRPVGALNVAVAIALIAIALLPSGRANDGPGGRCSSATRSHLAPYGARPTQWGDRRVRDRRMGCPGGGVRGTGFYLARLNKDQVVHVEQSVEQDVFSDAS
jgi:hypothetical protein